MALLLHIAQVQDIDDAAESGSYRCASIEAEGFIHCCKPEQLQGVIDRYYNETKGLRLLQIDPELLHAKLVYENTVGGDELFPHVYGEINMDAVINIAPM